MNAAFFVGRLLFGGFFLYNGINHLRPGGRQALAQYAAAKGVPYPEIAVAASGLAMALGGAGVIAGIKPALGSAAIGATLSVITPTIHDFWNATDSNAQSEMINFSKNVALMGTALILMSVEQPWPASLAGKCECS